MQMPCYDMTSCTHWLHNMTQPLAHQSRREMIKARLQGAFIVPCVAWMGWTHRSKDGYLQNGETKGQKEKCIHSVT